MFGFSPGKLILTILVVAIVWYGYNWLKRVQIRQEEETRARVREEIRAERQGTRKRPSRSAADAEEMVKCPTCSAYVAASGARNCGRSGCPYPG